MTNKNKTAVVLIIDRSGSMSRIAEATTEALNEFVNGQKAIEGDLTLDAVFFDNNYDEAFSFVDPKVEDVDLTVHPRGMTALYDAIGRKITSFEEKLSKLSKKKLPDNVLFVIATDGHENSSVEYRTSGMIAELIERKKADGWKFTFIGANQDAVLTAKGLGINAEDAITFSADAAGIKSVVGSMSTYTANVRSGMVAEYTDSDREAAVGGADIQIINNKAK